MSARDDYDPWTLGSYDRAMDELDLLRADVTNLLAKLAARPRTDGSSIFGDYMKWAETGEEPPR